MTDYEPTGELALARRGMAALETLIALGDAQPTADQRQVLSGWCGWGPLAKALNYGDGEWYEMRQRIGKLISYSGVETAKTACDTAFYTPRTVIRGMWDLLEAAGFGGGEILEPGCGSGRFMAATPDRYYSDVSWTGIEADKVSAAIAQLVNPDAVIVQGRLEKQPLRQNRFDAVLGNVPFSQQGVYDPNAPKGITSLHGYFLWRALNAVRPGGIVAVVTSRWILDAATNSERDELAKAGIFLGALRLPSAALAPGGTRAVTDIIVFRRRTSSTERHLDDRWLGPVATPEGLRTTISQYFHECPERVLGTMEDRGGDRYGMTLDVALPEGQDLAVVLDDAVQSLAGQVTHAGLGWVPRRGDPAGMDLGDAADGVDPAADGAFTLHDDGTITQQRDGRHHPVRADPELASLIRLKTAALALFAAEADSVLGLNAKNRIRQEALRRYQTYIAWYGYLGRSDLTTRPDPDGEPGDTIVVRSRPAKMGGFRQDPDWPTVLAVEMWDDDEGAGQPAPILLRPVGGHAQRKEHTADPAEALALCLDRAGAVDLAVLAGILQVPETGVPAELGTLIWEDPADQGTWLPADEYLSGNVRVKLSQARSADEADPGRWAANVQALEAVQPEDLGPDQINVQLGSPWLPTQVVADFICHILRVHDAYRDQVTVRYEKYTSTWDVRAGTPVRNLPAAKMTWGTTRVNAVNLIGDACNNTTPTVYDKIDEKDVKNQVETGLAADKIRDLQEKFAEWWAEDPQRADALCGIYNERFNATRVRTFDGSMLTFPGLSVAWGTPYPSQLDMIWRNVCTGTTLCGHVVGAGKAQPMDALILTPTGYRRMGDLMAGDEVISVDGKPVPITGVFPQGPKDVYRVTFSDGATTECNDKHLWEVTTSAGRSQGLRSRVFTLRELMDRGLRDGKGNRRWAIPIAQPADFDGGLPRPLDPYLLGLLLGDGNMTHGTVNFTTADPELRHAVQELLPVGCELISRDDPIRPHDYKIRSGRKGSPGSSQFIDQLFSLGLMGMNARYKHIPQAYKEAPIGVRIAVLQGLMDTDGTVTKSGGGDFFSSSRRLAEDVAWLARSLGGIGKIREQRYTARPGQVYYGVTVAVPDCPFRLTRKAELWRPRTKYPLIRMIDKVEKLGVKPMQCIMVDHPRQLYVTDGFLVTHNTFIAVATAMKMRELGFARKPALVVPNHLLEQTCAEARRYFPGAAILMVTKEDLNPARRRFFAAKCAARDWDLVVATHQQWLALPVDPATQEGYFADLLDELDVAMNDPEISESRTTSKMLARKRRRLIAKMDALADVGRDCGLTFEQTLIDYAIIDEAHMFKNLEFIARAEGFNSTGSKRADDMLMKFTYLRDRSPDGRVGMMMTGTPISNSLSELHVLFRYCAPHLLAEQDLVSFDGFAAQYIRYATATEVAPDGGGFRSYRRPRLFVNLTEVRAMLWQFADIRTRNDLALDGPAVTVDLVAVEGPPELGPFTAELVKRADDIRAGNVKPAEDNMLRVCGDGRAAALWLPLVGLTPTGPGKVEQCAANVARIYHQTKTDLYPDPAGRELFHTRPGALQVVFCDLGTPKQYEGGVYDYLRDLLVHAGVPQNRIVFIHDAKSHEARKALFADCRNGKVSVLVGSTEKMGTGVNIQRRLRAIHHLDAPWRPADLEQRDGRGDRPGNANETLAVYRYATTGSFDAYMWQALERKKRFIDQVLCGDPHVREVEAVDNPQVLSYGQLKALATGQPLLLMLSEVNATIARLRNSSSGHKRSQQRMLQEQKWERDAAARWTESGKDLRTIAAKAAEVPTAGDELVLRPDDGGKAVGVEAVQDRVAALIREARMNRDPVVKLGSYRGAYLTVEVGYRKSGVVLTGLLRTAFWAKNTIPVSIYGGVHPKTGAAAVLDAFDRAIDEAAGKAADCDERAARALAKAAEMEPYLNVPWDGKEELAAAVKRRADIERDIDAQVKDSRKQPQPA